VRLRNSWISEELGERDQVIPSDHYGEGIYAQRTDGIVEDRTNDTRGDVTSSHRRSSQARMKVDRVLAFSASFGLIKRQWLTGKQKAEEVKREDGPASGL
jgi:hypothetical protein